MKMPGFTAESSTWSGAPFRAHWLFSPDLGLGVIPADSQTCNCNCGGGSGGGGTTNNPPPTGTCACSSFLGAGCSVTGNSCLPGFVPQCNCGFLGNSCNCVPGSS